MNRIAKLQTYVINSRAAEKVCVTPIGVYAFGTMPDTNQHGWYFVGRLGDLLREVREATQ